MSSASALSLTPRPRRASDAESDTTDVVGLSPARAERTTASARFAPVVA
ncbi:hypothetical protein OG711_03045 [Streptomyces uncialis]|nr:hypothetical protein [Streptomyces uncialis]